MTTLEHNDFCVKTIERAVSAMKEVSAHQAELFQAKLDTLSAVLAKDRVTIKELVREIADQLRQDKRER